MIWFRYIVPLFLWTCCNSQNVCEEPPEIDFGEIVSDERTEHRNGDRIQYRCFPGYALEGPEWITCKGPEWTPAPKCLAPCTITKRQLEAKNLVLSGKQRRSLVVRNNQTLEFLCREGYVLSTPSIRKCIDGHMNLPSCISERGKNCSGSPAIENGDITTLSQKQYPSGSSVEFKCQRYYAMEGDNRSFCNNGNWTKVPVCLEPCVISLAETERQNISVKLSSNENKFQTLYLPHGDSIELSCKPGHVFVTDQSVFGFQCRGEPIVYPKCKEIICNPGNIGNGQVTSLKNVYKEGDELQFECNSGYKPVDRPTAVCSENGWNTRLECTEIVCSHPTVNNGRVNPKRDQFSYEETIQIVCDSDYEPERRQETSKCTQSGWNPLPKCVSKRCYYPEGENIEVYGYSGLYRYDHFPKWEGDNIYFRCKNGFLPESKKEYWEFSSCTKSGWDPTPKCLKKCDHTEAFPFGRFIYFYWRKFIEGNEISFSCAAGYYPEQEEAKVKCTKIGWSPTPRCISRKIPTCKREAPPNGFFTDRKDQFALNERTRYRCHSGYTTREGLEEGGTQCLREGWIPKPECVPIQCEGIYLHNGIVQPRKDQYLYNDVVQFSCRTGYTRVGPTSAQCYHFGWSPPPPVCKASGSISSCQPPSNITDGKIITGLQEEYSHGHQVEYECNIRYAMTGSQKIECVDGRWTSLPSCTVENKACRSPPFGIRNGRKTGTRRQQYFHGETVKYECDEGFALVGTNLAKCLHGWWNLPSCANGCARPEIPKYTNSDPLKTRYRINEVVRYSCGSSQHTTRCVKGNWSPKPDCRGLCPPPPHLPNATEIFEVRNYENGEKIQLTCKKNFLLEGQEEILCEDGKWKNLPLCIG